MRHLTLLTLCLALAACSKLVDLDGLTGGKPPPADAGGLHDAGAHDGGMLEPDGGHDGGAPGPDTGVDMPDAGNGCPTGFTPMSRITAGGDSYCIDQHEVTAGQYQEFIEKHLDPEALFKSEGCAGDDVMPLEYPPAPGAKLKPVVGVSMCGAEAYCSHAGKALCGDIGGSPVSSELANDPDYSAYPRACTGGTGRSYPYGDTYDPDACNGDDNASASLVPAASLANCRPAEAPIFDLVGNAWEWVDACETDMSQADSCRALGGAFNSPESEVACNGVPLTVLRATRQSNLGFRCCAY